METWQDERLTDAELKALLDQLFPQGFAGADVFAEIAPEGWQQSPLLACFHPSIERVFEERLQIHHNVEAWRNVARRRNRVTPSEAPVSEPTLEDVCREYQPQPVRQDQELTELVGQCLWDVFSDNHDVIADDGRVADTGSFRGTSAFLDEYAAEGARGTWREGDYMRFYMGTIWTSGRADLTPVYAMIFRRLKSLGADWVYHFPELRLVDLAPLRPQVESPSRYSPSEALGLERKAREDRAELERLRGQLAEINAGARADAMDRPAPAVVLAYRLVYGHHPRGWPPA